MVSLELGSSTFEAHSVQSQTPEVLPLDPNSRSIARVPDYVLERIDRLSPLDQRIVELRAAGWKFTQMADLLQTNPGRLRIRYFRVLRGVPKEHQAHYTYSNWQIGQSYAKLRTITLEKKGRIPTETDILEARRNGKFICYPTPLRNRYGNSWNKVRRKLEELYEQNQAVTVTEEVSV